MEEEWTEETMDARTIEELSSYEDALRIVRPMEETIPDDFNPDEAFRTLFQAHPHLAGGEEAWLTLTNKLVVYRFFQFVKIFGPPDALIPTSFDLVGDHQYERKMGRAIWVNPKVKKPLRPMFFLREIVLYDTLLAHYNPVPHVDFLFTKMEVPYKKKRDLYKLSGLGESITFDLRFKTVSAGCHFLPANLTSHFVTVKFLMGEIADIVEARTLYAQKIGELMAEWKISKGNGHEMNLPAHWGVIDYLNRVHLSMIAPSRLVVDSREQKRVIKESTKRGSFDTGTVEEEVGLFDSAAPSRFAGATPSKYGYTTAKERHHRGRRRNRTDETK